jgi:hypothetical protein
VPEPAKRRNPDEDSSTLQAILAVMHGRAATVAPGTILGAGVYLQTGRLWQALLLACLIGPPTRALQKVAAQWIELQAPPKKWRRPRRRGT